MKWHYFWPVTQVFLLSFLLNWFISDFLLDCWKPLCIHNTNLSWSEKATRYSTRRTSRKRPISAFFPANNKEIFMTRTDTYCSPTFSVWESQLKTAFKILFFAKWLVWIVFCLFFTGTERNTTVLSAAEKKIPLTLHVSSFKVMQIWSKTKVAWIVGFAYPYSSPSNSDITENWA